MCFCTSALFFFFFNDTATTEIYTLSLHDALPIFMVVVGITGMPVIANLIAGKIAFLRRSEEHTSELSHGYISYAVFCLKKKKRRRRLLALSPASRQRVMDCHRRLGTDDQLLDHMC